MRKRKIGFSITYWDCLVLCLFAGLIAGSMAANLSGEELRNKTGYISNMLWNGVVLDIPGRRELMAAVAKQRVLEAVFGWLVGMTVLAVPCFFLGAFYAGVSAGMILSIFTGQGGIWGLPCYLVSIFPQFMFYLPLWYILAKWAGEDHRKRKASLCLLALLFLILGILSEGCINPYLVNKIFRFLTIRN